MMIIDNAMRVATHLQSENKLEQAKLILDTLLEAHPTHAYALHLSGIIAYQTGQPDAGIQLIQRAIESNANVALFHSNLGEMHRQLKDIHLSIQCGQRAVALDPNSDIAWSNLGIAYYDAKQYQEAEACHKRALALNPKLGASLNNMGSIYKTYGKIEQAIAFYQAAIAVSPHVEPLNNLGALFLQQQEFKQAFAYLNQAILLAPAFAEGHYHMGLALLGLKQWDEALLYFKKALQLNPGYACPYYGMAKMHFHKHDFIEAERLAQKAIAMGPAQVEFYQLLSELDREQGKPQRALVHLDHALSLGPTVASLYIGKGNLLMEMGEVSQAEEQFLKVSEGPALDDRILAHYSLALLQKTKLNSPSLHALLSIEGRIQEVSPSKREHVYFALGKCYDDLGEWAKSFEYFNQGCRLKRKRIAYHINEQIQFAQKLIHCFTQDRIEYLREFAVPSRLPIFIVGMPRSGTTLVEQALASHPDVYGGGELPYLNDLIQSPVESHSMKFHYPENMLHRLPTDYSNITSQYLFHLRRISSGAIRITDKMPHNFIAIGLIHALFPNAKIIHVKRGPIDTCLSCYTKLFSEGHLYSYDLTELGQYYNCYTLIMGHWRRLLPPGAFLDVQYEDLAQNQEAEMKRLLAYCGLSWDPACLAFYQSKRQVRTASFMQVRQPVYADSINRWRRFEKELAPLIKILNHEGAQSVAQQQA